MVTLNTTPNRGYQEPAVGNTLEVDVGRLIAALRAIDVDVADALAQIVAKAGLNSPAFTGTPTAPTAAPGTDSGQLATTAFVRAALAALVDSAPGALDTLNELAAAIGDDPNFAATMAALIGTKADAAATTAALAGKAGLADKNTFTKTQVWSKGADVASASALTLGDDGNYFDITGTTAITSIATKGVGTVVKLHFDGALTLTHHATDLVLPDGVNITTAAGDEAEFIEYATGDWRMTSYTPRAAYLFSVLGGLVPAKPQTASGVGQFILIDTGASVGSGYSLPSGGTWAYFTFKVNNSTGTVGGTTATAGVAAGGTSITGGTSGFFIFGFAWRIA